MKISKQDFFGDGKKVQLCICLLTTPLRFQKFPKHFAYMEGDHTTIAWKKQFDDTLVFNANCSGMPVRETFMNKSAGSPLDARGCIRDGKRVFLNMFGVHGASTDMKICRPAEVMPDQINASKEKLYLASMIEHVERWLQEACLCKDGKETGMHATVHDDAFSMEFCIQISLDSSLDWNDEDKREKRLQQLKRGMEGFLGRTQMSDEEYKAYKDKSIPACPDKWDIDLNNNCIGGTSCGDPVIDAYVTLTYRQQSASAPQKTCDQILDGLLQTVMNRVEDLREGCLKDNEKEGKEQEQHQHAHVYVEKKRKLGFLMYRESDDGSSIEFIAQERANEVMKKLSSDAA